MDEVMIEIVTVTEISGNNVSYSGSKYVNETNIYHFPHAPKVGEQFCLVSIFTRSSVLMEIKKEE